MAPKPKPTSTQFDELGFRYSNYDTPFWVRPNSESGRWHRIDDGPTQYLSTTVEGAWAELIRAEDLRSEQEVALVRMPMWVANVHVQPIADYATFEKSEAAGFSPDALIDDDYSRCQEEGMRLRTAGFQGVLAPSAALPGAVNLTLFGPRIASSWQRRPLLASAVSATRIAVGSPPDGIVQLVRYRGEGHDSYEEFLATRQAPSPRTDENR
jgi:RES domain-containing protein